MDHTNKTILISVASTDIARHCALRLVKAGFKIFAGVRSEKAREPSPVAESVLHALTAKRLKARYVVGWDARIYPMLSRLLPAFLLGNLCGYNSRLRE